MWWDAFPKAQPPLHPRKYAPRFSWGVFLTPYCLSPAPQAEPQAAGFSTGLSPAPQAEPQAAGFSAGLSAAPQAVAGAEAAFLFQPKRSERAIVVYLQILFSGRFALLCLYCTRTIFQAQVRTILLHRHLFVTFGGLGFSLAISSVLHYTMSVTFKKRCCIC